MTERQKAEHRRRFKKDWEKFISSSVTMMSLAMVANLELIMLGISLFIWIGKEAGVISENTLTGLDENALVFHFFATLGLSIMTYMEFRIYRRRRLGVTD